MDKINFKYKDINFAESGAIVSFDKKKEILSFLSPNIHILGFYDIDNTIVAICLEFGLVADGKDKKETMGKILSLTKYFLLNNKKSAIENILKSSNMDQYWALYRLYEKRHAPKKIKINQQAIEKRNKVGREKLVDDYKKLQYKSADCLFIRENNELFSNKQDKTGIITMPVGENMQWAGR